MEQAIDHLEGGDLRRPPGVGLRSQQRRQAKGLTGVFFKLVEFAAGVQQPRRDGERTHLPTKDFILLGTAVFVLAAAVTMTASIAPENGWKHKHSRRVGLRAGIASR